MRLRAAVPGRRVAAAAALSPLLTLLTVTATAPVARAAAAVHYGCTGAPQTYVVPADVYALDITLAGSAGGGTAGGRGGTTRAVVAVTPGTSFTVTVGCRNGFNGGGIATGTYYPSHTGGGGTDLRLGGSTLYHRVLIAGGGGGGGNALVPLGGGDGGPVGTDGVTARDPQNGIVAEGGGGGTQTSGGRGPSAAVPSTCARSAYNQAGTLGAGGRGARSGSYIEGGAGGGGYYGGGGGDVVCQLYGGGGGGSSYGPPGTVFTTGTNVGDGYADIVPAERAVTTLAAAPASGDCAADPQRVSLTASSFLHVETARPDPDTLWVCVLLEQRHPVPGTGGKLVISTAGAGATATPVVDAAADACAATTGNTAPGPHPLLRGAVGDPADPATYLPYLLDVYAGSSGAWLCAGAGAEQVRVGVATPGATPPVVSYVADPPSAPLPPAPAMPATPSGACVRSYAPTFQVADATVAGSRAFLYASGLTTTTRLCVALLGPVNAGGMLTVDASGVGVVPPTVTTSTTDMTPCTVQVVHNDSPVAVDVRRSPTGAFPASVCLSVAGSAVRVTLSGAGASAPTVTWTPDPGTPGAP